MSHNRDTNPQNTAQLTPTLSDDSTSEEEPDPTLTTTEKNIEVPFQDLMRQLL